MARRGKDIPPEDVALWAEMMEDVTPLPGHARPVAPDVSEDSPQTLRPAKLPKQPLRIRDPEPALVAPIIGSGIDLNTRKSLERGQMAIEATLDLHGHNRDEGRSVMTAFLLSAYHEDKRCVLVITGKGRLTKNDEKPWWDSARGVLKSSFNDWVREPPLDRVVLHTALARGKHGGGGAYYVLLRQKRDK